MPFPAVLRRCKSNWLLPFLETIAGWMDQLAKFVNKLGEIPQPLIGATLIFLGIAGAAGLAMVAIGGIAIAIEAIAGTAIGATLLPIAAAVLGLALASAGAYLIWANNWGSIQQKTQEVIAAIQPQIDAFAASLTDIGTKFTTAFEEADIPTFDELFADLLEGDFRRLDRTVTRGVGQAGIESQNTISGGSEDSQKRRQILTKR